MEFKVLTLLALLVYIFFSEPYINKEVKEPILDANRGYNVNPCNCKGVD